MSAVTMAGLPPVEQRYGSAIEFLEAGEPVWVRPGWLPLSDLRWLTAARERHRDTALILAGARASRFVVDVNAAIIDVVDAAWAALEAIDAHAEELSRLLVAGARPYAPAADAARAHDVRQVADLVSSDATPGRRMQVEDELLLALWSAGVKPVLGVSVRQVR